MSIFSKHALPEVPLEELIQLRLGMGLYVEAMKRTGGTDKDLPLAIRMYEEIIAEMQRRLNLLPASFD